MPPKGEQATATILDVAEELFLTKGYNGTSMRDIANAAGYKSVAGLYNHFSDKETIFTALLADRSPYEHVVEIVQTIEGETSAAFIGALFPALISFLQDNMNFFRLVMTDYLEFNGEHVRELLEIFQAKLFPAVMRLHNMQDINPDLPPIALIRLMGMQLFGYVMTANLMPDSMVGMMTPEEWQHHIVQFILHGIQK